MIVGPPAAPIASTGRSPSKTSVGDMLESGRLPGAGRFASAPTNPNAFGAPASAANLVVNPGFESGNTGFTSGYAYSPGNLLSAGTYDVGSSPKADNGFFTYNTPPHSGNLEMIFNGASTANVPVWGESGISVLANTTYYFSAWIASVTSTSPAQLDFSINGSQIGSTFTATSTGEYEEFFATWSSGAATTARGCPGRC